MSFSKQFAVYYHCLFANFVRKPNVQNRENITNKRILKLVKQTDQRGFMNAFYFYLEKNPGKLRSDRYYFAKMISSSSKTWLTTLQTFIVKLAEIIKFSVFWNYRQILKMLSSTLSWKQLMLGVKSFYKNDHTWMDYRLVLSTLKFIGLQLLVSV